MNKIASTIMFLIANSSILQAEDDTNQAPLPISVLFIEHHAEHQANTLKEDYNAKLLTIQQKEIDELNSCIKELIRDNKLDMAVQVKGEVNKIQNEMVKASMSEDDVVHLVENVSYDFIPQPGYHHTIHFGHSGQITDGQNDNENTWRVVNGKLEILNSNGVLFSRWTYDPSNGSWTSTMDQDCILRVSEKLMTLPNN